MEALIDHFEDVYGDCTLTDVWYAGDEVSSSEEKYYWYYYYSDVIVFYINFDTGPNVEEPGGIYKNSTITKFSMIFGRRFNGKWHQFMGGYAETEPLRYLATK